MARLEHYDFIPGENARVQITVKNTTVSTAQLVSKLTMDGAAVSDLTITTTLTAEGQITTSGADSILTFTFSPTETNKYNVLAPYYMFDVKITDDSGNVYNMGIGKLHPQPSTV